MLIRSDKELRELYNKVDIPVYIRNAADKTLNKTDTQDDWDILESYYKDDLDNDIKNILVTGIASHYQFSVKDYNKATMWWKRILGLGGDIANEALLNISFCYCKLGKYHKAIECYEQVKTSNPGGSLEDYVKKAISGIKNSKSISEHLIASEIDKLAKKGDLNSAIKKCNKILEINPGSKTAHFKLAHLYGLKKEPEMALSEFRKAGTNEYR